jgi:hypothetical protein
MDHHHLEWTLAFWYIDIAVKGQAITIKNDVIALNLAECVPPVYVELARPILSLALGSHGIRLLRRHGEGLWSGEHSQEFFRNFFRKWQPKALRGHLGAGNSIAKEEYQLIEKNSD